MKPRISVITLAVSDLNRSLAFYRDGMGLLTEGIVGTEFEDGAVVFFHVNQNLILALYPKNALAKDAHVAVGSASAAEFSIGHNVGSKPEVDAVMHQAKQAGAKITDPALTPAARTLAELESDRPTAPNFDATHRPEEAERWEGLEDALRSWLRGYGYRNIRTPILEQTGLFRPYN